MEGLRLRLLTDDHGSPGRWFWQCFEPLRSTFDELFWIFTYQPWVSPDEFDEDREIAAFPRSQTTSVQLWRPGAIGRWAERFSEEEVELWAVAPGDDPSRMASEFVRANHYKFIQRHAVFWLRYLDRTYWQLFTTQSAAITSVREGLKDIPSVRVEETPLRFDSM